MKKIALCVLPAMLMALTACQPDGAGVSVSTDVPETDIQKRSYALGQNMASGLRDASIEYDASFLYAGFADARADKQLLTNEEMSEALMTMQQEVQQRQFAEQMKMIEEKAAAAQAYLENNAGAEGVVTTDSGLQYKVITEGDGAKPTTADTVTVHYEGRLTDGTVFDSSVQRGEPASFPLGNVIPGWVEALQLMPLNAKYQLTIPPELAYGQRGSGAIGPNEVLIFDVELLAIESPEKAE